MAAFRYVCMLYWRKFAELHYLKDGNQEQNQKAEIDKSQILIWKTLVEILEFNPWKDANQNIGKIKSFTGR